MPCSNGRMMVSCLVCSVLPGTVCAVLCSGWYQSELSPKARSNACELARPFLRCQAGTSVLLFLLLPEKMQ